MNKRTFDWSGFTWEVAMQWGDHHPADGHQEWYGPESVNLVNGDLRLDVLNQPRYFADIDAYRQYNVGCVHSREAIYKGYLMARYVLPVGRHLWPAIWLYAMDSWPPEIDIVEGWTGKSRLLKNRRDYLRIPFKNNIYPSLHYTDEGSDKHLEKALHDGWLKGTMAYKQPLDGECSCELLWYDEYLAVRYNGHTVAYVTDKKMLSRLDKPMMVVLDLSVNYSFTEKDYQDYALNGRPFTIKEIKYENAKR